MGASRNAPARNGIRTQTSSCPRGFIGFYGREFTLTTSLIDELQLEAADGAVSVSALLRKALIVAGKLELSDIPEWINKELSGYEDGDSLPSNRIIHGRVKARSFRGWIPAQLPTDELEEMISKTTVFDSVAQIEALIKQVKDQGELAHSFPRKLRKSFKMHLDTRRN